jgi:serine/threonine protein kinase
MPGGTITAYLLQRPEGGRSRYVCARLLCFLIDVHVLAQVADIVRGLAYIHSLTVVHGDLKAVSGHCC